mgnify:CR=1 FL=1
MIGIEVLRAADRATWEPLARAYKHFYRTQVTPAEMDAAWQRHRPESPQDNPAPDRRCPRGDH